MWLTAELLLKKKSREIYSGWLIRLIWLSFISQGSLLSIFGLGSGSMNAVRYIASGSAGRASDGRKYGKMAEIATEISRSSRLLKLSET